MTETNSDDDVRGAVRAALEQHGGITTEPIEQHGEVQEAAQQVTAQLNEQDRQRTEPQRDGRGRFAPKSTEAVQPDVGIPTSAEMTARPPTSWSPEAKSEFAKLSPAVQQAVLKREDEMSRGMQQYSDERQRLRDLDTIIAPRRDYLRQFGFNNDVEAVKHMLTISDGFATNPAGMLQSLAQHFRIGPEQIFPGMQGAGPSQQQIEQYVNQRIEQHPVVLKAYEILQNAQRQERVQKKRTAANASLNGAPHGIEPSTVARKSSGRGAFGDIADDVRAAISAHS